MILTDVNVLVDAFREDSPVHGTVNGWLESRLVGNEVVGVPELVGSGFLRIVTNLRVYEEPSSPEDALDFLDALYAAPAALRIRPGERHWTIFTDLVRTSGARANLVPDAHLAALALENGATWATRDRGFARFPGLRLLDPTAG